MQNKVLFSLLVSSVAINVMAMDIQRRSMSESERTPLLPAQHPMLREYKNRLKDTKKVLSRDANRAGWGLGCAIGATTTAFAATNPVVVGGAAVASGGCASCASLTGWDICWNVRKAKRYQRRIERLQQPGAAEDMSSSS